jgi:Undecaprenyl-phosphate galactose phosphotransferase WbaP
MITNQVILHSTPNVFVKAGAASSRATSACIITADFLALSIIYWVAVIGRYLVSPNFDLRFYLSLYPVIALFLVAFYTQNLYPGVLLHPAEEIRRVAKGVTVVFLLVALSIFFERNADIYSRSIFLMIWASGAPSILLGRRIARNLFSKKSWWGIPVVVLGHGRCAERIVHALNIHKKGLRLVGVLTDELNDRPTEGHPLVRGNLSAAPYLAKTRVAEYAIVAVPEKTHSDLRYVIQTFCRGFRHVLIVPDLPGFCSVGLAVHEIGGQVGLELPQRLWDRWANYEKRLFDALSSLLLLLLFAPIFLVISLVIKLSSRGPVFFGHKRYGQHGAVFKALKFRTMAQNAEQLLKLHLSLHPELRVEWERDQKLRTDPRITSVGKWLRRYSLDELPQLLNVLLGQMSLVGPRPIVENEIGKYGDGYDLYTRVPPGITGLWQVSGRNKTTYAERVALDEYYVRNWSVWLDAYILAKTFRAVVSADGAY